MFPVPDGIYEFFSAEVITGESLFLAEHLFNLYLSCNTGVVGSGNPERAESLHSFVSYDCILH